MARDLDRLRRGLEAHLARGAEITGIRVMSAGHSNETYLVEGLDLILRMPPSEAPLLECAVGVRPQFDIFAVVRNLTGAPPVPRVCYCCDDPSVLGDPFFLMERVAGVPWGDWGAPAWAEGQSEAFLGEISRQVCLMLAGLHRLPPLDVLGPVRTSRQELARWKGIVTGLADVALQEAFALLDARAPECSEGPAPCHGDPKLANMLWDDGRLAAVLDWEMSFNGDPRWDLAYNLTPYGGTGYDGQPGYDLPGLWRPQQIVAEWEHASGRSAARLRWFEAASFAKVAAILVYGLHLFATGKSSDPRYASWEPAALSSTDTALRLARREAADFA